MDVLMLGGANTVKSTFLVQLYGRMTTRIGQLVSRCAPADLKPISDGLQRLASGIPLEHTRTSADHLMQHLPAATHDGRSVDFNIPEYAGETLDDLVRSHRIPEYWRPLIAESDQWLLFVRLEQFGELPELQSRPIKEPEAVLSSAARLTKRPPLQVHPDTLRQRATVTKKSQQLLPVTRNCLSTCV